VSCLCRYVSRPKTCHWTAAKRVLRYLKGSSFSGIVFSHHSSPTECSAFVDSTWGSGPASVVSVSGQLVCLGPVGAPHTPSVGAAPISWRSALQTVVAQSTCEAEYIAVASVSQEILFVRQLLTDLGLNLPGSTPVFCDNQSAIRNVTRGCTSQKTRHISNITSVETWRQKASFAWCMSPQLTTAQTCSRSPCHWLPSITYGGRSLISNPVFL
jgi:hypothetical protein